MARMEFGASFLPELERILLSTGEVTTYGPDGRPLEVGERPFLGEWQLRSLAYDPEQGSSRAICRLSAAGREVTATIDASDFPDLLRNKSRNPDWNNSAFHDLAVHVSTLIQEQILTWDPTDLAAGRVRIRRPADRHDP